MSDPQIEQAVKQLKTIANPTRLRILLALIDHKSLNVSSLEKLLGVEQSQLSHYLAQMKDRGLLESKRDKHQVYYSIANTALIDFLRTAQATIPLK